MAEKKIWTDEALWGKRKRIRNKILYSKIPTKSTNMWETRTHKADKIIKTQTWEQISKKLDKSPLEPDWAV